jgi:hypothetical protein
MAMAAAEVSATTGRYRKTREIGALRERGDDAVVERVDDDAGHQRARLPRDVREDDAQQQRRQQPVDRRVRHAEQDGGSENRRPSPQRAEARQHEPAEQALFADRRRHGQHQPHHPQGLGRVAELDEALHRFVSDSGGGMSLTVSPDTAIHAVTAR